MGEWSDFYEDFPEAENDLFSFTQHLEYELELREKYPNTDIKIIQIFEDLVYCAASYKLLTGRYLSIFGELGELFAEITFDIKRHKPGTPGSDGKIGNDFVEVKTITPEKKAQKVSVKRKGNFNKLVVVKINKQFAFEARMLDRKKMRKGKGKLATVSWSSMGVQKQREGYRGNDRPA